MKAIIARIVSPVCYFLGHSVSLVMHRANVLGNLYPIYNRLMIWSWDVEDWAGIEYLWTTAETWSSRQRPLK